MTWPLDNGSWVISQRTASGEFQPTATGNTAQAATIIPELSSNSSSATAFVSFLRPLELPAGTTSRTQYSTLSRASGQMAQIIHASSTQKPSNPTSPDQADMQQHDRGTNANAALDLSTAVTVASTTSSSAGSSESGTSSAPGGVAPADNTAGYTTRQMYIIAHAVLAGVAWMVLAPLAVLVGRYGRTFFSSAWFRTHQILNIFVVAMTIATFGLGVYLVGPGLSENFDDTHQVCLASLDFVELFLITAVFRKSASASSFSFYSKQRSVSLRTDPTSTKPVTDRTTTCISSPV